MRFNYEGAILDLDLHDSYQRTFAKQRLKKVVGRFIGKPWKRDDALSFAFGLKGNPIVIDVGCNIGGVAIPIAKRFPEGLLVAVDAYAVPLARLIRNMDLSGVSNVRVVAAAISDQPDPLNIYPCATNSGGNRVTGFEGRADARRGGEILVPTMSVSKVFAAFQLDRCDLLKVDVEGYEVSVLRSCGGLLTPGVIKSVIAEYGPEGSRSAGVTGWELVELMLTRGYRCRDLHSGKPIEREADIPLLPDFSVTDFLFEA